MEKSCRSGWRRKPKRIPFANAPARSATSSRRGASSAFSRARRRQPSARATSAPARLPLSTVETYRGRSGARVRVSYQLRRCPSCRSRPSIVPSIRSTRSSIAASERSRGRARRASRGAPSRCSSARSGAPPVARASSWRLSGGSKWSSGPTSVSKYFHVRPRDLPEPIAVLCRELQPPRGRGAAEPVGEERRQSPEDEEGQREGKSRRAERRRRGQDRHGGERDSPPSPRRIRGRRLREVPRSSSPGPRPSPSRGGADR